MTNSLTAPKWERVENSGEAHATCRLLLAEFRPEAGFELRLPKAHNCFGYIYDGSVQSSATTLGPGTLAVFEDGDQLSMEAGAQGAKILLCDGMPFGEPVARYGPFVMNTREELMRAFQDYERGVLTG